MVEVAGQLMPSYNQQIKVACLANVAKKWNEKEKKKKMRACPIMYNPPEKVKRYVRVGWAPCRNRRHTHSLETSQRASKTMPRNNIIFSLLSFCSAAIRLNERDCVLCQLELPPLIGRVRPWFAGVNDSATRRWRPGPTAKFSTNNCCLMCVCGSASSLTSHPPFEESKKKEEDGGYTHTILQQVKRESSFFINCWNEMDV